MTESTRPSSRGYAVLVALVAGGLAGTAGLGGLGVRAYFAAAEAPVRSSREGRALADSLEGALAFFSFGVLSFLVALVAFVVLLKSLSDDVARARRGPV